MGGCSLIFYFLSFTFLNFFSACVLSLLLKFPFVFIFFLVSLFSSPLSIMASFEKVKDVHGWLADREAFDPRVTRSKVNPLRQIFGLKYEVPEERFLVSDSKIVGGVKEGYFFLITFACNLRFPISNFMVEVLRAYNVVPS